MKTLLLILFGFFLLPDHATAQSGGCASGTTWEFIFGGQDQNVFVHCGIVCDSVNNCDTVENGNGMNILSNGIWKVGGDTCMMETDPIILDSAECSQTGNVTQVTIKRDKEGQNVPPEAYMVYHIYCADSLVYYDSIPGDWPAASGNSNVRTDTINVECGFPDTMYITVTIGTQQSNKKLKILEGGSCVTCLGNIFLSLSLTNETIHFEGDKLNYSFEVLNDNEAIDYILLARSTDGKNFLPVGYFEPVPGKQPRTLYTLSDPDYNQPAYYRAEVRKLDGSVAYSKVLFSGEDSRAGVSVYPNPVRKGQTLHIDHAWGYETVTITDVRGRVMSEQALEAGGNGRAKVTLPSNTSSGLYFLQFSNGFQSTHFKVMVQD